MGLRHRERARPHGPGDGASGREQAPGPPDADAHLHRKALKRRVTAVGLSEARWMQDCTMRAPSRTIASGSVTARGR